VRSASWSSRNPCSSGCLGSKVIWRLAFGVRRSAFGGAVRTQALRELKSSEKQTGGLPVRLQTFGSSHMLLIYENDIG
jgi:hypothetical protein